MGAVTVCGGWGRLAVGLMLCKNVRLKDVGGENECKGVIARSEATWQSHLLSHVIPIKIDLSILIGISTNNRLRRETPILARGLGGVTFYLFAHYSLLTHSSVTHLRSCHLL